MTSQRIIQSVFNSKFQVASKNHQIQSYSRRFLNPRRPDRKPTAEEQEEFLIQYEPILPDDPRRVLSHNYVVCSDGSSPINSDQLMPYIYRLLKSSGS
jgi:hypothetical protein